MYKYHQNENQIINHNTLLNSMKSYKMMDDIINNI